MGLSMKFNLVLIPLSALGVWVSGYSTHKLLEQNAREEVLLNARIMMEMAQSIRRYTVDEVRPLLTSRMKNTFLPQAVSAYAATKSFEGIRGAYPEYTYKEAALNPTNPIDRATDWETDAIKYFVHNPNEPEIVGERDALTGNMLFIARPIRIENPGCLTCHSTPAKAPAPMIARYGDDNGFGWQLNEVVGAQVVSIPMTTPLDRANHAFLSFMSRLVGLFLILVSVGNLMLYFIVIRPVNRMTKMADQMSKGQDAPVMEVRGNDQIASLGHSFNRMRLSISSAMQLLEQTMDSEKPSNRLAPPATMDGNEEGIARN
ncbi:c-type heme family protein [Candidatus Thiosymbion oneisti]|uniref:c-type heme family protein n=2 Tax=Candidatus Thiosymbion oneisti TaxID=589554 RepID=UPI00105B7C2B|nr:DUF3365 domain-containing protein [Candidatus Thiosymbion oneisti]